MNKPEVIITDQKTVSCDGNGIDPGHPRVFLTMGDATRVVCPYCGRIYAMKKAG